MTFELLSTPTVIGNNLYNKEDVIRYIKANFPNESLCQDSRYRIQNPLGDRENINICFQHQRVLAPFREIIKDDFNAIENHIERYKDHTLEVLDKKLEKRLGPKFTLPSRASNQNDQSEQAGDDASQHHYYPG